MRVKELHDEWPNSSRISLQEAFKMDRSHTIEAILDGILQV